MAGENVTDAVSIMLEKRRPIILGVIGAVVAVCLIFVAGTLISQSRTNSAIKTLDENLAPRYEKLTNTGDNPIVPAGFEKDTREALLKDLAAFGGAHAGYAAGKAWTMAGNLYFADKKWKEAEDAYTRAAETSAKTYLAPIARYNAGAAAEEAGNPAGALAHYEKAVGTADFPYAAHAEFSIGRLYEWQKKKDEAKQAYQKIIDTWPYETSWVALARDRLIVLGGESAPAPHNSERAGPAQ
jgi:tetratricopeptide (TPR) repeat protein